MTSKEKALELYKRFNLIKHSVSTHVQKRRCIECALICVDEIITQWEYIDTYISDFGGKLNPNLKYWLEVKQELLKL